MKIIRYLVPNKNEFSYNGLENSIQIVSSFQKKSSRNVYTNFNTGWKLYKNGLKACNKIWNII